METMISLHRLKALPKLIVFDLDDCLWSPEMYLLRELPTRTKRGVLFDNKEGVTGVHSGREIVQFFPEALSILQTIYADNYLQHFNIRVAIASSADTPLATQIAKRTLSMLEIVPGVTALQFFQNSFPASSEGSEIDENDYFPPNIQIGREYPLSSDKSRTHFPIIREGTGIPYVGMIFFDDCHWSDNCGEVARNCPGVIAQRTPDNGLRIKDWNHALLAYSNRYGSKEDVELS